MANGKLVLVLGVTGGIGGEVARQLRDAGWNVRALQRGLQQPMEERNGVTWLQGDAMNRDDVLNAARGCAVIVHAVNPPGAYFSRSRTVISADRRRHFKLIVDAVSS